MLDSLGTPRPTQQWNALAAVAFDAARPLLQNREDCLEAAQETMAALWQAPEEPEDLHAWVRVVAWRKACDIIRAARHSRLARDRLAEVRPSLHSDPIEGVDDHLHVTALMADLPPRERMACVLVWIGGMSRKDAADHMGVTDETVKTWLSRARERMRDDERARRGDA